MLYPIELNVPVQATGARVSAGATTVDTASDFYYKVNGSVFGPFTANDLAELTGYTIEDGFSAVFTYYIRKDTSVTGNVHVLSVEKSEETPINTFDTNSSLWTPSKLGFVGRFNGPDNTNAYTSDLQSTEASLARAVICSLLVVNDSGSQFVGGTTLLDDTGITAIVMNAVPSLGQ